jgi:hypothetical protein
MGGIFGGGGSGGGGGGGSTQTITKSDPWAGQQPYLYDVMNNAQWQFRGGGPKYYQGNTLAPLSGTTQQALDLTQQRALNGNPLVKTAQDAVQQTASGAMLNSNPWLDANFKAGTGAITQAYNDAVNGQTSGFAGGGRMGSGMQAFYQDRQNDTLAKNLNNLQSQTYYDNYTRERQNQLGAAQLAPIFAAQDYQDLNALGNVGTARDDYAQSGIDADKARWDYNQNLPANNLAQYMAMVQGNYGGSSSSSATSTPTYSKPSFLGNALGTISTAAGLYSLFSDRRLKTDVAAIGKADNGLPIYRFRYVDSPETHIGFMADEVQKLCPEAVQMCPEGYLMVNYGLATQGMEALHG